MAALIASTVLVGLCCTRVELARILPVYAQPAARRLHVRALTAIACRVRPCRRSLTRPRLSAAPRTAVAVTMTCLPCFGRAPSTSLFWEEDGGTTPPVFWRHSRSQSIAGFCRRCGVTVGEQARLHAQQADQACPDLPAEDDFHG